MKVRLLTKIFSQLTVYDQCSQMLLIGQLKEQQIHCLCPQVFKNFLTWQVDNAAYFTHCENHINYEIVCHKNNHKVGCRLTLHIFLKFFID